MEAKLAAVMFVFTLVSVSLCVKAEDFAVADIDLGKEDLTKLELDVPTFIDDKIAYENPFSFVFVEPHTSATVGRQQQLINITLKSYIEGEYVSVKADFNGVADDVKFYRLDTTTDYEEQYDDVVEVCKEETDNETNKTIEVCYSVMRPHLLPVQKQIWSKLDSENEGSAHTAKLPAKDLAGSVLLKIDYATDISSSGKWSVCIFDDKDSTCIDPWWNSTNIFPYRIPITITNPNAQAYENVTVNVTVDTTAFAQEDCGDGRIVEDIGTTTSEKVRYWQLDFNSTCKTNNSNIFFKLRNIGASASEVVYFYYGNSTIEDGFTNCSIGNENKVWGWCRDGNDATDATQPAGFRYLKWAGDVAADTAEISIRDGGAPHTKAWRLYRDDSLNPYFKNETLNRSTPNFPYNYSLFPIWHYETDVKKQNTGGGDWRFMRVIDWDASPDVTYYSVKLSTTDLVGEGSSTNTLCSSLSDNTWYDVRLDVNWSSDKAQAYKNGALCGSEYSLSSNGNYSTGWETNREGSSGTVYYGWVDNMRIWWSPELALTMGVGAIEHVLVESVWSNTTSLYVGEPVALFANVTGYEGGISYCSVDINLPSGANANFTMKPDTYKQDVVINLLTPYYGYDWDADEDYDVVKFFDRDWNTMLGLPSGNEDLGSNVYYNYTKPTNYNSAIWETKHAGGDGDQTNITNITIPASCLNTHPTTLSIKVHPMRDYPDIPEWARSEWYCMNSTGWQQLYNTTADCPQGYNCDRIHEQRMWFYDTNNSDYFYVYHPTEQGNYTYHVDCTLTNGQNITSYVYGIESTLEAHIVTQNSETYTTPVYETQNASFTMNFSVTPVFYTINASLLWNGTVYQPTFVSSSGSDYFFRTYVSVPFFPLFTQNVSFVWQAGSIVNLTKSYQYTFGDPSKYTYNSSSINVSNGIAQLKIRDLSQLVYANFDYGLSYLTYSRDGGSLVPIYSNTSSTSTNKFGGFYVSGWNYGLFCDGGGTVRYFSSYNATNNLKTLVDKGTISLWVRPAYSGSPLTTQTFMIIGNPDNQNSRISFFHATNGTLTLYIYNDTADLFVTITYTWNPTAGTWYHLEADFDVTTGASRMFVDGVQRGSTSAATGVRTSAGVQEFMTGTNFPMLAYGQFIIDDIAIYNEVKHTTGFTPPTSPAYAGFETSAGVSSIYDQEPVKRTLTYTTIQPNEPMSTTGKKLTGFYSRENIANLTAITFVLSNDNSTWYYWNTTHGLWQVSLNSTKSSSYFDVNAHIETFNISSGTLYWKAYLQLWAIPSSPWVALGTYPYPLTSNLFTPVISSVSVLYEQSDNFFDNLTENQQEILSGTNISAVYTPKDVWVEGETFNLTVNVTKFANNANLSMNVTFNNTNYTCAQVFNNTTLSQFQCTFLLPTLDGLTLNQTYFYTPYLFKTFGAYSETDNSSTENITLYQLTVTNCSAGDTGESLRFMIQDEELGSSIAARFEGTFFLLKNAIQRNYSFNFTGQSNYSICLYPAETDATLTRSVMFFTHDAGEYSRREFNQIMLTLNGSVQVEQIYLLNETESTKIVIDVRDEIGVAQVGYFVKVLRYFVGSNEYKLLTVVEIDNEGKSEAWLKEDEKYRYIIQYGAEVVSVEGDFILLCTATPCVKKLVVSESTVGEYLQYLDTISMSCSETGTLETKGFECVYTDTAGGLESVCLNIYSTGMFGRLNCSDCSSASTGILSCYLGNITGKQFNYRVVAALGTGTAYNLLTSGLFGSALEISPFSNTGLFASTLIVITMGMMGMFNPVASIVMTVGAVLASMGLGIITLEQSAFISLLVAGAIMAKKAKT